MNKLKAQHTNEIQYVASDSDRGEEFNGKTLFFVFFFQWRENR